jgi:hypothetical protein
VPTRARLVTRCARTIAAHGRDRPYQRQRREGRQSPIYGHQSVVGFARDWRLERVDRRRR